MAESHDERHRLIEQLASLRLDLNRQTAVVREDLNLKRHVQNSIRKYSWGWVSFAAMFGWLLSRLPARKKKVYLHALPSGNGKRPKVGKGVVAGLVLLAWNAAWALGKPLLTAYLTKRFSAREKVR
jgi:hypothetical protein